MHEALRSKLIVFLILLGAGLMWWVLENHPSGPRKGPHPGNQSACAAMGIEGVKEGLIEKVEDDYSVVDVTDRWDQVIGSQKDQIGKNFALCRSPDEVTEIRRASDNSLLRTFVINLDFRMKHGLPIGPLVPGQN